MPLVSELTVIGEVAPLAVWVVPPSLEVQVAVKPEMVPPPALPAVKATVALLGPWVNDVIEGAPGRTAATKELDGAEAEPAPTTLDDVTVQE